MEDECKIISNLLQENVGATLSTSALDPQAWVTTEKLAALEKTQKSSSTTPFATCLASGHHRSPLAVDSTEFLQSNCDLEKKEIDSNAYGDFDEMIDFLNRKSSVGYSTVDEFDDLCEEIDTRTGRNDNTFDLSHAFSDRVLNSLEALIDRQVTRGVDEFERRWEQTPYMALFAKDDSYRSLVVQVAHDFKRYFFDKWAQEMRSQRPQHSLRALHKIVDSRLQRSALRQQSCQSGAAETDSFIANQFEQIRTVLNEEFLELKERLELDYAMHRKATTAHLESLQAQNDSLSLQMHALQRQCDQLLSMCLQERKSSM